MNPTNPGSPGHKVIPKYTPPKNYKPDDWLKGSTRVGGDYTAFDTYGQGRPDFGHGAGPGTPYHTVQKKVQLPKINTPKWGIPMGTGTSVDPRISAIRRRLGWAEI